MRDDEIRTGVRRLFRLRLGSAARIRAEVDEELASLLEARIDDLVARGSAPADARAAALRRLGGDKTLEQVRDRLYHSATHREDRMRFREQFHGLQ